jgi:hypothetical protein
MGKHKLLSLNTHKYKTTFTSTTKIVLRFSILPWLYVKGDFLDHVMLLWLKAQSQIPSTMWLWTSGKTGTMTQNGMPSARLHDFYRVN